MNARGERIYRRPRKAKGSMLDRRRVLPQRFRHSESRAGSGPATYRNGDSRGTYAYRGRVVTCLCCEQASEASAVARREAS